jgi:hypothetical protein
MARAPRHQLMRRPIAIQAGLTGALTKDVALNLDRAILVGLLSEQFALVASYARGWRVRALPLPPVQSDRSTAAGARFRRGSSRCVAPLSASHRIRHVMLEFQIRGRISLRKRRTSTSRLLEDPV